MPASLWACLAWKSGRDCISMNDPAGRVLDDRHPVPDRSVTEQLLVDVGDEHDLGADLGEHIDRGVEVVRLVDR